MSSCQRFVQNAWKKELCSNCFKSKEEHASIQEIRSRYLTSIKNLSNKPPPQSILKGKRIKRSSARVSFPAEESQVIGYGGEEVSDDDDFIETCLSERNSPELDITEGEEEKALQRLTKSNTDYNSNPANLSQTETVSEVKKTTFAPLLLGKPLKDADGRKQTLLVSVQPFGADSTSSPLAVSRKAHLNNLLQESKESPKSPAKQNSDHEKTGSKVNGVILNDTVKGTTPVKVGAFSKIVLNDSKVQKVCSDERNTTNVSSPKPNVNNEKHNSSAVSATPVEASADKCDKSEKVHVLELSDLNPSTEVKKSQILRGSVLTKTHDQGKTKRYFSLSNSVKSQEENKKSDLSKKNSNDNKKENIDIVDKDVDTIKTSINVQQKNIKNISGGMYTSRLVYTEVSTSSEESDSNGNDTSGSVSPSADKNNLKISVTNEPTIQDINCVKLVLKDVEEDVTAKQRLSSDKEVTLQVMKILNTDGTPAESREMAGEPDGRADPDENDDVPPEIPSSPPPLLTTEHIPRASFLHNLTKEKPKIPAKPKLIDSSPVREIPPLLDLNKKSQSLHTIDPQLSPTENGRSTKRPAPKPPASTSESVGVFTRNHLSHASSVESPVIRQREKKEQRERAASCSPLPSDSSSSSSQTPEPAPRRLLSLSQDSLAASSIPVMADKKRSNKVRLTLRKFLRLASRDDEKGEEYVTPPPPPPRPRLEIIHPLDLNKSGVQVLRGDGSLVINTKVEGNVADSPSPTSPSPYAYPGRPSKPPPPPRSQSLDSSPDVKPARPPPPKAEFLNAQRHATPALLTDTVYANIGEARSGIAPNKPQRTASIRESQSKEVTRTEDSHYEHVQVSDSQVFTDNENLYECLAPECDLNRERSSLPYCSSETESDIYYPYNFANTQDGVFKFVGDEEPESPPGNKSVRLRNRKGRSIVHKSLEENYGAVVIANHEALSQLVEQMNQSLPVPMALRVLKATPNLQWSDFTINDDSTNVVVGGRVFLNAQWNLLPVTLCLTVGQSRLPNSLSPITQFFDLVASKYVNHEKTELVQVSVAVLVHQQVFTIQSFSNILKGMSETARETALVLVQLINGLKNLQARGIEDTNLSQFVLCRDEREFTPRVCLLPQDGDSKSVEGVSLCQFAVTAIDTLPPSEPLTALLRKILVQERATSLSQAKAALELWLWGPTQVPVSSDIQESLQRWLDLERATVLQSLVINRPPRINIGDYCHLSFLVRTNAKIMADAMILLDKSDPLSC